MSPKYRGKTWGERRGSNPRHPGPQPGALPAELRPPCVAHTTCTHGLACIPNKGAYAGSVDEYFSAISRSTSVSGPGAGANIASR